MKCLSVSQPFAELIVSGRKTIETRSWNTKHRGELLIHSPKAIRTADCQRLDVRPDLPVGAIVGRVELCDVKIYTDAEFKGDAKLHLAVQPKRYGFVLKKPIRFKVPIRHGGMLGVFEVDAKMTDERIKTELIDEEYRYRFINMH